MREFLTKPSAMLGAALAVGLSFAGSAQGWQNNDHAKALHGGKMAVTKAYHFEVVVAKDGLTVYPRTHEDKPIDASSMSGSAVFFQGSSPTPWLRRKLTTSIPRKGGTPSSIGTAFDLSKLPAGVKVEFHIEGLPEPGATTASFTMPVSLGSSNEIVVANAVAADAKAIESQKTCPVSKEDLGSMGAPIKVSRGDAAVFLCCRSCLKTLKANPDKFLGKVKGAEPAKVR